MEEKLNKAEAEVERLRGTLDTIARYYKGNERGNVSFLEVRNIARQALQPQAGE